VVRAGSQDRALIQKHVGRALESAQKYSLVANSIKSSIRLDADIEIL
jgi:hypothetical protein